MYAKNKTKQQPTQCFLQIKVKRRQGLIVEKYITVPKQK
jgi:hypothetical protein